MRDHDRADTVRRFSAMCVDSSANEAWFGPSPYSQTWRSRVEAMLLAHSAHSMSAKTAGSANPHTEDRKETPMTPSPCNYTIAPMSDSEPVECGRVAIRRVILAQANQKEMFYCYTHWNNLKDMPLIQESAIEDLTEEQC